MKPGGMNRVKYLRTRVMAGPPAAWARDAGGEGLGAGYGGKRCGAESRRSRQPHAVQWSGYPGQER